MDWLLAIVLAVFLAYLVFTNFNVAKPQSARGRLCDYTTSGAVFEDVPSALARGVRLMELHVYSDEQDHPVVAKNARENGLGENVSFESCCVDIANGAFPSKDPFVLSIVAHTDKSTTLNECAYHLKTTVRKHLVKIDDIHHAPIDSLADKLIVVSGGNIQGTDLESLVNLSWSGDNLRRLSHHQAAYPREKTELIEFNRDRISLVAPDPAFSSPDALGNVHGCQWRLFPGPVGFLSRS